MNNCVEKIEEFVLRVYNRVIYGGGLLERRSRLRIDLRFYIIWSHKWMRLTMLSSSLVAEHLGSR